MGSKSQLKTKAKERVLAKEAAQREWEELYSPPLACIVKLVVHLERKKLKDSFENPWSEDYVQMNHKGGGMLAKAWEDVVEYPIHSGFESRRQHSVARLSLRRSFCLFVFKLPRM